MNLIMIHNIDYTQILCDIVHSHTHTHTHWSSKEQSSNLVETSANHETLGNYISDDCLIYRLFHK